MGRLPLPPAEIPVCRDLQVLAPGFRMRLDLVIDDLQRAGFDPMVVETLRTSERQRFLFGFGRDYDDGRGVVTHSSDCDETWHGFGLAADIISASKRWDAAPAFWTALGAACRIRGLTWGGDWNGNGSSDDERFVDRPHVQFGPPMRRSPSPRAARLLAEGGMPAVWKEVGAL
ncbi:MAG: M15 family metallopeptidase [Gemmatimonadaceae bacterium]|nr:M15 family metallopeptidase [Gemmatimonadaceae bacterium]